MLTQHAEEIRAGHTLAYKLGVIILEKRKEDIITNTGTQIFKKARASQIDLVPIWTLTATIINRGIHKARLLEFKIAIVPPPLHQIGMHALVVDAFTICGKRFIQPRLQRLIISDAIEPPLMRRFVRRNNDQIVLRVTAIQIKIITADEIKTGKLH